MGTRRIPRTVASFLAILGSALAVACGGSRDPGSSAAPDGKDAGASLAGARLEVACAGPTCGAASASAHSGAGTGIWRYRNGSGSAVAVRVAIDGVKGGQQVVLLQSNGQGASTTLPSAGTGEASEREEAEETALGAAHEPARRDRVHAAHLERERVRAAGFRLARARDAREPEFLGPAMAAATAGPSIGATRTWYDTFDDDRPPVSYPAVARAICTLPTGRKAIFWVDPQATAARNVSDDDLAYFQATLCGASGGYALVTGLRGDVWGPFASAWPTALIQDAPGMLQDLHVVFLEVPRSTPWGGYFSSANNFLRSYAARDGRSHAASNESLVFFLNAPDVRSNRGYFGATLLHELTHMVDFYQRSLQHEGAYDAWLTEMSAMMTEDAIAPAVAPDHFQKIPAYRVLPAIASGGGVSLVDWVTLSDASYDLGGSFGAFLDRRYGLAIYSGMVRCAPELSGHACIDALIRANGGEGFADEYARFGATLFGLLSGAEAPAGYGFPQVAFGGRTLAPIDLAPYASARPATAAPLGERFAATTLTYRLETVATGRTTYARDGVVVPAGATLMLVIR